MMSGGHWDYRQQHVTHVLDDVGRDHEVRARWPHVAQAMRKLADALGEVLHDMDWCLSDDTSIDDDGAFDQKSLELLRQALVRPATGVRIDTDNNPGND